MKPDTAPKFDFSPPLCSVSHALTPVSLCILPCLPGSVLSSMCASCAGLATVANLVHLLSRSIFLLALPCLRWGSFSARRLRALLPLFCQPDSIALILPPHRPLGSPTVSLARGRGTPTSSLLRPCRPSLRPTSTSGSAMIHPSFHDPSMQPSNPRRGSPGLMRPCMLMHKGRQVLNRPRHDYLAYLHLRSHMHWHLPQVMTRLPFSLQ